MSSLKSKIVLITGAASGIGRATAQRFYAEGSRLILVDRPTLEQSELTAEFSERMTYISGDITSPDTMREISSSIAGGIDVVINNAGITRDAQMVKMSDDDWQQVLDVNLTAVFKISRLAVKQMIEQGRGGVILTTASVVAHYGNFGQTNYAATKAGVIAMAKSLAREVGKFDIRVNAVAPGFIGTPMVQKMPEKILTMMAEKAALKRIGEASEIAAAFAFLASDEARFITGTCLNVDGGLVV